VHVDGTKKKKQKGDKVTGTTVRSESRGVKGGPRLLRLPKIKDTGDTHAAAAAAVVKKKQALLLLAVCCLS